MSVFDSVSTLGTPSATPDGNRATRGGSPDAQASVCVLPSGSAGPSPPTPVVLQLPIGSEGGFLGVIDLVTMEAVVWKGGDLGASFETVRLADCNNEPLVDDELKARAAEWCEKLVELAVDQGEDALMEYLEGNELDFDTLKKILRKGTLNLSFVPVVTGTALKNKGVEPLVGAAVYYLPSPVWRAVAL